MLRTALRTASRLRTHGHHRNNAVRSTTARSICTSTTTSTTSAATAYNPPQPPVKVAPPGDGPNHRSVLPLDGNSIRPYIQFSAYVAPSATVIGSVILNDHAAAMYGSVLRGDLALIHVGIYSVVGENATLTTARVTEGLSPSDAVAAGLPIEPELVVGDFSTVGAGAHLHACFLDGDNVVGCGAVMKKGSRLERNAELLAGASLEEGVQVPEGEIWGGCPAVKVGVVSADKQTERRKAVLARAAITAAHSWEFLPGGTCFWEKEAIGRAQG